jgi:hypothetical protein
MYTNGSDPYTNVGLKLSQTGTIVLSDQDGTRTYNSTHVHSAKELKDRAAECELTQKKGVVTGTVSARTLGLTISEAARLASRKYGFDEPEPRWRKTKTGRYTYVDPAKVPFFRDSLDRDISAGFGSGIILRNSEGYMVDWEYDYLLNHDHQAGNPEKPNPMPWRQALFGLLVELFPLVHEHLAPIEYLSNYEKRLTNVAPLRYRIQLIFKGKEGLEKMKQLQEVIQEKTIEGNRLLQRIAMVDESHPKPNDPEHSVYTLYLIPYAARKENMINWLVGRCAKAAGMETKNLKLFYAGDTLTDLRAGLYGGGDADTTFLLATGSRVAPYILNRLPMFGNEPLDFLWSSGRRPDDRLRPTDEKGIYTFNLPGGFKKPNRVIIGDERYPNMTPPGSVHAFLHEYL